MWNPEIKDLILKYEGSIQNIQGIPDELKEFTKQSGK